MTNGIESRIANVETRMVSFEEVQRLQCASLKQIADNTSTIVEFMSVVQGLHKFVVWITPIAAGIAATVGAVWAVVLTVKHFFEK